MIPRLVEAILRQRQCRLRYAAPNNPPKTLIYHPYRLMPFDGGLYCLGFDKESEAIRTLAVDRILALDLLADVFDIQPGFDPIRYARESFGIVWETPLRVVLRFRQDQTPYVAEREWHETQSLRTLRDGRTELQFQAGGRYEIVRWILSWGAAVEVVRPASLRKEIAELFESAAKQYREPGHR